MTGNWILVDRSDPVASSPSSELMLDLALKKCSAEHRPVVLVLDSPSRFMKFRPSLAVNRQLMMLAQLLSRGKSDEIQPPICEMPLPYGLSEFEDWISYHLLNPPPQGPEPAPGSTLDLDGDRRLPRRPEDAMVAMDKTGRLLKTKDGHLLPEPA